MLLGTGPDEAEMTRNRGLSAAQLQLLKAEALKSLRDDTLKIDLIARRCGVSPRHVQRLFERAGPPSANLCSSIGCYWLVGS